MRRGIGHRSRLVVYGFKKYLLTVHISIEGGRWTHFWTHLCHFRPHMYDRTFNSSCALKLVFCSTFKFVLFLITVLVIHRRICGLQVLYIQLYETRTHDVKLNNPSNVCSKGSRISTIFNTIQAFFKEYHDFRWLSKIHLPLSYPSSHPKTRPCLV